jgi:hypothetical protein
MEPEINVFTGDNLVNEDIFDSGGNRIQYRYGATATGSCLKPDDRDFGSVSLRHKILLVSALGFPSITASPVAIQLLPYFNLKLPFWQVSVGSLSNCVETGS